MPTWICDVCGLEHPMSSEPPDTCVFDNGPLTDEETSFGPHTRRWLTHEELAGEPHGTEVRDHGRGLHSLRRTPRAGIGQWSFLVATPGGNLLWDPPVHLDDEVERLVRDLGGVAAIATSHPHMFAAQVSWSHAFGHVPVLVNRRGARWVSRPDPVVQYWDEAVDPLPGLRIARIGGHMPSSAVARTVGGDLLVGDTVAGSLDPNWVSFQRNVPRHVPMSAATVRRIVDALEPFTFDRLYTLGGDTVENDAHDVVRRAARRHIRWVSGEFDHLT